jgi:hypothetical protein
MSNSLGVSTSSQTAVLPSNESPQRSESLSISSRPKCLFLASSKLPGSKAKSSPPSVTTTRRAC